MRRTAALGLVAVVFAVGLATGLLGARLLDGSSERHRGMGPPPLQRYFSRGGLDLSADQERRMEEVFSRQREKFEALHRDLRPEVEGLMDETQAQVEAILTPDQLEHFRRHRDRWRHTPGRHGEDRPGAGHRPRYRQAPPEPEPAPPSDSG